MALDVRDMGERNVFENASTESFNAVVQFRGDNNRVVVGAGCTARRMKIDVGSDCLVEIGDRCALTRLDIYAGDRAEIRIGETSVFNYSVQLRCHEPSSVTIGKGLLCASGVMITTSDMHSIFDLSSGKRINPAKDIRIGDTVWIGQGTYVLKGSSIGSGTVIGAQAVVTGSIPNNVIAAGAPARVIREGVYWKHELE